MFDTVKYEQHGDVALIAINRPDSLNSFTSDVCRDLLLAFDKARDDAAVRSVVLTGEGRAFSAGLDFASFQAAAAKGQGSGGNLLARSAARCSTGWCVGPSSPSPIESWVIT